MITLTMISILFPYLYKFTVPNILTRLGLYYEAMLSIVSFVCDMIMKMVLEVTVMEKVQTSDELMLQFMDMNREDSVRQVFIPGRGKFTIVLQEEDERTIAEEAESNPELERMLRESMVAYKEGRFMTTAELLKALSPEDFRK